MPRFRWQRDPVGQRGPGALREAGGAAAQFIAGFGAAGYATRRDLAPIVG